MLGTIFERFVEESPVSVMMRGLMERVFAPEQINRIFEENAKIQYTRELLFSSLVELMSLVVCGIHPSVNAAYRAKAQQLNVSRTAVYEKRARRRVRSQWSNSTRDSRIDGKREASLLEANHHNCCLVIKYESWMETAWKKQTIGLKYCEQLVQEHSP